MLDTGTLSSKSVTEVLMLEMKLAPTAKTYLVSGYPRSMRDVTEYSDKIQTINGVILVSWRQRVLERQIDFGARLGHVVLSLAKMELKNFYKNVMPVADYFDQTNMLIAINGERNPDEVYKDFRAAVLQILGSTEDQSTMNGVNGVGVGAGGIPGEIVGVEPAPRQEREREPVPDDRKDSLKILPPVLPVQVTAVTERVVTPKPEVIRVRGETTTTPILWVVGGPGSNKAALCQRAVAQRPGWTHFSLGQRLRSLADAGGRPASDGALARMAISGGELAPKELVTKLVRAAVNEARRTGNGLVLDGYPRDLDQMEEFETEYQLSPRMVLLDCSKLQLGRGRRDDSVAAFRRRLEVFRELSLPMLKAMDQDHRLVIVDGDTESPEVQLDFASLLVEEMEKAEVIAAIPQEPETQPTPNKGISNMTNMHHLPATVLHLGTGLANGHANGAVPNGNLHNGNVSNGFISTANNKVKPLISNVSKIPTVSQRAHDGARALRERGASELALNTHM
ncbi:unnamed protein product [Arctia plantaginis]|uniref:Adenylate kinase isoenzyme 5 n=1 Tax=Arctia plantaginis TaxID=874455 RepID=A0A8S0ZIF3_ARCPL|nr:unnamed protein product [Arctia plantaginis]